MRASLKTELESRFKSLRDNPNFLIATLLDPRFESNQLGVLETEKAEIMLEYIKKSFGESCSDSNRSSSSEPSTKQMEDDGIRSKFTREVHDTFQGRFK